ncbi:hypothetical protein LQW54_004909 [Pestalotiopsis sp. IQ-011]
MDRGPMVIIPPRQIRKVYSLPEDVLDVDDTQDQTLQVPWTVWDRMVTKQRLHLNVVRHQLNRNLTQITEVIAAEIAFGFSRVWGDSSDWVDVKIWDTCLRIIAGAANGAFCGQPLCRDPAFLDCLRDHAVGVFSGALLVNLTPWPLKSLSGLVAAQNGKPTPVLIGRRRMTVFNGSSMNAMVVKTRLLNSTRHEFATG